MDSRGRAAAIGHACPWEENVNNNNNNNSKEHIATKSQLKNAPVAVVKKMKRCVSLEIGQWVSSVSEGIKPEDKSQSDKKLKKKKDPDNISDTVRNKERGRKTETFCVQS